MPLYTLSQASVVYGRQVCAALARGAVRWPGEGLGGEEHAVLLPKVAGDGVW